MPSCSRTREVSPERSLLSRAGPANGRQRTSAVVLAVRSDPRVKERERDAGSPVVG
jgi:hypothetical protein